MTLGHCVQLSLVCTLDILDMPFGCGKLACRCCNVCMQIKMHWVGAEYWKAGPDGNDIHKTNVPNLRMRFRYDCHSEELNLVMSGAATYEVRKAAKHRD